jgi:hypothetical protein
MLRNALLVSFLSLGVAAAAPAPDVITPDGGRYYGPLAAGKLQGRGRLEWDNGTYYEGSFADGLFSGHGRYHFSNGVEYEGEFRQGLFWGKGELRYANGRVYRGDFVRNELQGKGRLETPEGEAYEGDFAKDNFTGNGIYIRKDGARYEGEFRNYVLNGRGRLTDKDGNVWEGTFVDGEPKGEAKVVSALGVYEGGVKNWTYNGKGVLKLRNGDVYVGYFEYGMYSGEGTLTYAKPKPDGRTKDSGVWRYGSLPDDAARAVTLTNVETALYTQRQLLDKALASLQPRAPGRINLYLLAVAGDGSQEVFRREVGYVQNEFAQRFGTAGRTVTLVNSRNTIGELPMATTTSIRESLKAIAARMDVNEDVLFLFMTSHGSRDHELSLTENGLQLRGLSAVALSRMLKDSGIRWKVVVVSACYSGGFIEPLQDGRTLVIAAARKDRTSFGCADENDFTYFGRAYFKESLPKAASFQDAFRMAAALVNEWEVKDASAAQGAKVSKESEANHSFPQISSSPEIDARLKRWWTQAPR